MTLKQNAFILHENIELEVKLVKKMWTACMAIVECDPLTFSMILKREKLNAGWCGYRVFEHVRVFRCFKCEGFNHKANDCKVSEKCKKCIGDHEEKVYLVKVNVEIA